MIYTRVLNTMQHFFTALRACKKRIFCRAQHSRHPFFVSTNFNTLSIIQMVRCNIFCQTFFSPHFVRAKKRIFCRVRHPRRPFFVSTNFNTLSIIQMVRCNIFCQTFFSPHFVRAKNCGQKSVSSRKK